MSTPSNIYARLLLPEGHGYPLYFPEPNECLPEKYRELGTRIGDVGIVAEDGSFDYLFNVCRAADDPINLNRTPDDFECVELREDHHMRINTDAHAPKSYVTSTTVKRIVLNAGSSTAENAVVPAGIDAHVRYTSSSVKGAMVALPNGATRLDLRNKDMIRQLALRCGASWYKYANVDQGRMAPNGSLYVVTGCDKANSFQLASWSCGSGQHQISVTFTAAQLLEGRVSYTYSGEMSSPARVRVGPREPPQKQNQCIFLRGFKVAVREAAVARLVGPVSLTSIVGARPSQILPHKNGGVSTPYNDSQWWQVFSNSFSGGSSGGPSAANAPSQFDYGFDPAGEGDNDVRVEQFPPILVPYHPSDAILRSLLDSVPDAQVALTDDEVWMNALKGNSDMPSDDELLRRVSEMYIPTLQSGGTYLVPIDDRPSPIRGTFFAMDGEEDSIMLSGTEDQETEYGDYSDYSDTSESTIVQPNIPIGSQSAPIKSGSPSSSSPHKWQKSSLGNIPPRPRPRKRHEGFIPRPENAFVLFRRKCCEDRAAERQFAYISTNTQHDDIASQKQRNAEMSKTISQQWGSLSTEERQYWEDLAKEKKKEHAAMYPNYIYRRPQRLKVPFGGRRSEGLEMSHRRGRTNLVHDEGKGSKGSGED